MNDLINIGEGTEPSSRRRGGKVCRCCGPSILLGLPQGDSLDRLQMNEHEHVRKTKKYTTYCVVFHILGIVCLEFLEELEEVVRSLKQEGVRGELFVKREGSY